MVDVRMATNLLQVCLRFVGTTVDGKKCPDRSVQTFSGVLMHVVCGRWLLNEGPGSVLTRSCDRDVGSLMRMSHNGKLWRWTMVEEQPLKQQLELPRILHIH